MNNYGTRLRLARKNKGLTQTELAEKLGITQKSYQRMETGNHDLKMSTIYQLCKALDISSDWLIGLNANIQNIPLDKGTPIFNKKGEPIAFVNFNDADMTITANDLIGNKPVITVRPQTESEQKRG